MERKLRRSKRLTIPRIQLEEAPSVENLKELIQIGKNMKFYKNINVTMLWTILPYLEELDSMIGMTDLKQTIFYQVIYYIQGMHQNSKEDYLHTVIYGLPGSGKTTVAKILGNIYSELNILSGKKFLIARREDFIADYLGQSTSKTKKLLESCIGGVLFIDEVYSLGTEKDTDSYSKEVIDTINIFLSEHKKDFCCIIAGYENEVQKCFFNVNAGLQRRFPWVHRIEEYNTQDLFKIFKKITTDNNWSLSINEDEIINIIDKNKKYFKNSGGDMENFFSKCKIFHSKRVFTLSKQYKFSITKEDIETTIKYIKTHTNINLNEPPPFMYL
jgi:SpoVK/Ycf46/Vps4 family AAA+-type ATPase